LLEKCAKAANNSSYTFLQTLPPQATPFLKSVLRRNDSSYARAPTRGGNRAIAPPKFLQTYVFAR